MAEDKVKLAGLAPEEKLAVSISPHISSGETVSRIMWTVLIALLPALAAGVYLFGRAAIVILAVTSATAMVTEGLILKLRKKPFSLGDGSALVTGILLGLNLPQEIPLWMAGLGSVFAVAIVKQAFGGLGANIFNPALGGRLFLLFSFASVMTTGWVAPRAGHLSLPPQSAGIGAERAAVDSLQSEERGKGVPGREMVLANPSANEDPQGPAPEVDAVSGATPLKALKQAGRAISDPRTPGPLEEEARWRLRQLSSGRMYLRLFLGNVGGSIGETSALALLVGAAILLGRRIITWHIPVSFLGTLALSSWILWIPGATKPFGGDPVFHLLSGGAVMGAFFMATDMVTSPVTPLGKLIFGGACGMLTVVIRLYGGFPEGVSIAIFLMNAATPLIDRHTRPRRLGTGRRARYEAKGNA